ncbi:MAG: SLC26A/SulP transporter family protein [Candidatus Lambdaproteobacteria bacterium]|nr:SLC26A/SulP transporter family protein [Candidatus Lambdaproteobacteria bacterium]
MLAAARDDLRLERIVPSLTGGLVVGVLVVFTSISYVTLVFSEGLTPHIATGVGIVLASAAVLCACGALSSSYPGTIAAHSGPPIIVLSLISTGLAARLQGRVPPAELLASVVATIGAASLLTGLLFYAMGYFRVGGLIRFIPYPVIGGVVASAGWLLMRGSLFVATGVRPDWEGVPRLFEPATLTKGLAALGFGVLAVAVQRRFKHYLVFPGLIVAAFLAFYGAAFLLGVSLERLQAEGWLLGAFASGGLWHTPEPLLLARLDWRVLVDEIPNLATLMVVCAITLLMNASGVELIVRRDFDLNRELRATGLTNMLLGWFGGMAGTINLSQTTLAFRMGAADRLAGLVSAGVCVAVLVFGGALVSILPRPIIAGLLLANGLALLLEWVFSAWYKLPRSDYAIVLLILLSVASFGYLSGVGFGLAAGVFLFVISYSRINVVKHAISGANIHSNMDRPEAARQYLNRSGDQIYILKLQGYLFFGTANRVFNQVRQRLEAAGPVPMRCALLDFRMVTGLDSSSVLSFLKLQQLAEGRDVRILLTHLQPPVESMLTRGGVGGRGHPEVLLFPDLHSGLQWGEDHLLRLVNLSGSAAEPVPVESYLRRALDGRLDPGGFLDFLERIELAAGAALIAQGTPSKDLFYIEAGRFRVELALNDGQHVLIRTLGTGTFVGEVAFYMGAQRSASVIAEQDAIVYRLSVDRLADMVRERPELAAGLHELIARILAERLADTNRLLQEVID